MAVVTGELRLATLQAEKELLGAILIQSAYRDNNEAIDYCRKLLLPGDFLDSQYKDPMNTHARIYQAMLDCRMPPHQIGVAITMSETGTLRDHDIATLIGMIAENECSLDYEHYADAVKQYAEQRNGIKRIYAKVVEI
jgi:replicative DNA helicase